MVIGTQPGRIPAYRLSFRDVVAFSREKGLFAGLTIEGAVLKPRNEWNAAYYGQAVSPVDILVKGGVSNPGADDLRAALAGTK